MSRVNTYPFLLLILLTLMSSAVLAQSPFSENSKTENIERLLSFQRDQPNMLGVDTAGFDLLLDGIIDGILTNYGRDRLCNDRMPDVEDLRARMHNIDEEMQAMEQELLESGFTEDEIVVILDFVFLENGEKVFDATLNVFDFFGEDALGFLDPTTGDKKISVSDSIYMENLVAFFETILAPLGLEEIVPKEQSRENLKIFFPAFKQSVDSSTLVNAVRFFQSPSGTKYIDLQYTLMEASGEMWGVCFEEMKSRYVAFEDSIAFTVDYSNRILALEKQLTACINNYTIALVHKNTSQQSQRLEIIEAKVKSAREELYKMPDCYGNEALRDAVYASYDYFYEAILFSSLSSDNSDCELSCELGGCTFYQSLQDLHGYLECHIEEHNSDQIKWDSLNSLILLVKPIRQDFAAEKGLCLVEEETAFYEQAELIYKAVDFINQIDHFVSEMTFDLLKPQVALYQTIGYCEWSDSVSYEHLVCLNENFDENNAREALLASKAGLTSFRRKMTSTFNFAHTSKESAVIRRISAKVKIVDTLVATVYPREIILANKLPEPDADDYPLIDAINQAIDKINLFQVEISNALEWYAKKNIPKEYMTI